MADVEKNKHRCLHNHNVCAQKADPSFCRRVYRSVPSILTVEFQSADCGCLNSYGCLIPEFFCGPFLTGISQEDIFEKGWGEKEREYEDENVKDRGREF